MRRVPLPALAEDLLADLEDEEAPHTQVENGAAASKRYGAKDGFPNQDQKCWRAQGNVVETEEIQGRGTSPQRTQKSCWSNETPDVSVEERKQIFSLATGEKRDTAGATYGNNASPVQQKEEQGRRPVCENETDNCATKGDLVYSLSPQCQEVQSAFSKASQQRGYKAQHCIFSYKREIAAHPSSTRARTTKYGEQSTASREALAFQHTEIRRRPPVAAGAPQTDDEEENEEGYMTNAEAPPLCSSSAPGPVISRALGKESDSNTDAAFSSSLCSGGEDKGPASISEGSSSSLSSSVSLSSRCSAGADSLFILSASARVELQALLAAIACGNRNDEASTGAQQLAAVSSCLQQENTENRPPGGNPGASPAAGSAVPLLTPAPLLEQQPQQSVKLCSSSCGTEERRGDAAVATAAALSLPTASSVSEACSPSYCVLNDDTRKSYASHFAAFSGSTGLCCAFSASCPRTWFSDDGKSLSSSCSNMPSLPSTSFLLGRDGAATAAEKNSRQPQQKWWEADAWRCGGSSASFGATPGATATAAVAEDLFALFTREKQSLPTTAGGRAGNHRSNVGEEQQHILREEFDSEDGDNSDYSFAPSSSSSPSTSTAYYSSVSASPVSVCPQLDEPFVLPAVLLLLDVRMYGRLCCVSRCVKRACESWATLCLEVGGNSQSLSPELAGSVAAFSARAAPAPSSPAIAARSGAAAKAAYSPARVSPFAGASPLAVAAGGSAATPLRYTCRMEEREPSAAACPSLYAAADGSRKVHGLAAAPFICMHFTRDPSAITAADPGLEQAIEVPTIATGLVTVSRASPTAAEAPGALAAAAATTPQLRMRAVAADEKFAAEAIATTDRSHEAAGAATDRSHEGAAAAAEAQTQAAALPDVNKLSLEGTHGTEQVSEGDFLCRWKTRGTREETDAAAAENSVFWLRYLEENFAGSFNQELEYLATAVTEEKAPTSMHPSFAGLPVGGTEEAAYEEGAAVAPAGLFETRQQPMHALRKQRQTRSLECHRWCSHIGNMCREREFKDEGPHFSNFKTYLRCSACKKERERQSEVPETSATPLRSTSLNPGNFSNLGSSDSNNGSTNHNSSMSRGEDSSSYVHRNNYRRRTGSKRTCGNRWSCGSNSSSSRLDELTFPRACLISGGDGGSESGSRAAAKEMRTSAGGKIYWSSAKHAAFSSSMKEEHDVGEKEVAGEAEDGKGERLILEEESSPSSHSDDLAMCDIAEVAGAAEACSSVGSGNSSLTESVCRRQRRLENFSEVCLSGDTPPLREMEETELEYRKLCQISSLPLMPVSVATSSSFPGRTCASRAAPAAVASADFAAATASTKTLLSTSTGSSLPLSSPDPSSYSAVSPTPASSFPTSSSSSFSSPCSSSSPSFCRSFVKSDTCSLPQRLTASRLPSASASSLSSSLPLSETASSFLPPDAFPAATAEPPAAGATVARPTEAVQGEGSRLAAEALALRPEPGWEAAEGQQVCSSVPTPQESEEFAFAARAACFSSEGKRTERENGAQRENGRKFPLFTPTGNVDSLLLCVSARLTAMVLVSSAKYMRQWQEVGLLAGWLWFQRNIMRRITNAQLQRWGVRSKRHGTCSSNSSSDSSSGGSSNSRRRENSVSFGARNLFLPNESAVHTLAPSEGQVKSSEHITWKMTVANWELFYDSVLAEMSYRARMLAEKILHSHKHLIAECDAMASDLVDVEEHLFCLPLFCEDGPLHEQQQQLLPARIAPAAAGATEEPSVTAGAAEKEQEQEGGGGFEAVVVGEQATGVAGGGGKGETKAAAAAPEIASAVIKRRARDAQDKATNEHAARAAEPLSAAARAAEPLSAAARAAEPLAAVARTTAAPSSVLPSSFFLLPSSTDCCYSSTSQQQLGGPLSTWKENTRRLRLLFPPALSLLKSLNEAWDDYEEWAAMACERLDCLDFRINQEREACDRWWPHTPGLFDAAKLQFRNFCLLHSQLMRSVCLALYALIHEVEELGNINSSSTTRFYAATEHQQLLQQISCDTGNEQQQRGSSSVAVAGVEDAYYRSVDATRSSQENGNIQREGKRRRVLSRSAAYKTFQVFEGFLNQLEALDVMDDGLSSFSTRERFRRFLLTPIRQTSSRVFMNHSWM